VSAVEDILAVLNELSASVFTGYLPVNAKGEPTRLPAVVLKQVGGGGGYSHDEGPAYDNPLWELRCWGTTYAESRGLAEQATQAIATLGMQVTSTIDDREPQTGTHSCVLTASGYFPTEAE